MKLATSLLLALALTSPALAEKIDLSASSCDEFIKSKPDEITIILAWLDAYYRSEDSPPVIDSEKFADNAMKLAEYCTKNPTTGLITATDELFGK